jgi:hypothetical protein
MRGLAIYAGVYISRRRMASMLATGRAPNNTSQSIAHRLNALRQRSRLYMGPNKLLVFIQRNDAEAEFIARIY